MMATEPVKLTPEVLDDMEALNEQKPHFISQKDIANLIAAARRANELDDTLNAALEGAAKRSARQMERIADLERQVAELEKRQSMVANSSTQRFNSAQEMLTKISELESRQPVTLESGEVVQLVPVELHASMIEAWASIALSRIKNPDANKGFEASMHETYTAILAASAKEMGK